MSIIKLNSSQSCREKIWKGFCPALAIAEFLCMFCLHLMYNLSCSHWRYMYKVNTYVYIHIDVHTFADIRMDIHTQHPSFPVIVVSINKGHVYQKYVSFFLFLFYICFLLSNLKNYFSLSFSFSLQFTWRCNISNVVICDNMNLSKSPIIVKSQRGCWFE